MSNLLYLEYLDGNFFFSKLHDSHLRDWIVAMFPLILYRPSVSRNPGLLSINLKNAIKMNLLKLFCFCLLFKLTKIVL